MSDIDADKDLARLDKSFEDDIRPIEIVPAGPAKAELANQIKQGKVVLAPVPETKSPAAEALDKDKFYKQESVDINQGDYLDLMRKDPTLRQLHVGAGWTQRYIEGEPADVDISCFLVDKTEQTRFDTDFIFYNQETGCDGAVRFGGDSRGGTGGMGDCEFMTVDLTGIPFDIIKVVIVFSIYDENYDEKVFNLLQDVYIRFMNMESERELARFMVPQQSVNETNAFLAVTLVREGPKWFLDAQAKPFPGGLPAIAKNYGIVVNETTG
jgi:tellurium resistance protein TerD